MQGAELKSGFLEVPFSYGHVQHPHDSHGVRIALLVVHIWRGQVQQVRDDCATAAAGKCMGECTPK